MAKSTDFKGLDPAFFDEDKARKMLEKLRWKDGVECPHCGIIGAYKIEAKDTSKKGARKGLWKCMRCRKQFTVTVNTIFEGSRIPLNKWLFAIHLICSSKKGMSAHQLHRMLGLTYKSAWFMAHRIRYAMSQEPLLSKLKGVVEIDETYIGGKVANMHQPQRAKLVSKGHGSQDKAAVLTLVERDGRVKTHHMEHVTGKNLKKAIRECVNPSASLMTDEWPTYKGLKHSFGSHESVNHSKKEYVRGECHVNAAESVHALLKRGVMGVYHHWSKKHLHRYLSEFDFRWNARYISDGERTIEAIKGFEGKRLMYRDS
jgi:transposase-like protein